MVHAGCVLVASTLKQSLMAKSDPTAELGLGGTGQWAGGGGWSGVTRVCQLGGLHVIDPTLSSKTGL